MNLRVITKPRNYDIITRFRNYVTTLVIHPAQFWRGNSMTDTKIVAVQATIVRFLFWKYFRWNPTKIDRTEALIWLCTLKMMPIGQFLSDFNDSHVILTKIVSRLRAYFQNKNRTIVARMATILVWVIEVYTVTFFSGRGEGVTTMALNRWPKVWSDLAYVIKIIFSLQMSSILLGPIRPRAAGESVKRCIAHTVV